MRRKLWGIGLLIVAGACAGRPAGETAVPGFSVRDRTLIAEYRVLERSRVPVLLALDPAFVAAAAQTLERIGAEVTGRRDAIGYLRAQVPLDALESVTKLEGLQAVQVQSQPVRSSMGPPEEEVTTSPAAVAAPGTPPTSALAADNPYTAESETQALAFKARYPQFDGRGVTIGFVEPAARDLQTMHGALDLAGRPLPKFAAYEFVEPPDAPIGFRFHANMVASVMAGAGFLGSRANGVAPAAQLAVFAPLLPDAGRLRFDSIESMLAMMSDPRVDVGQASQSSGDTSRLGGTSPHAIWVDRLIRQQGKPLAVATGNYGAALLAIGQFAASREGFSVGAYTPAETWRVNLGVVTNGRNVLPAIAPYGPARDGGMKPDFLALTTTLAELGEGGKAPWHYWQDDSETGAPELRRYGVSGGTSAAAPHAAGHIALLVSAARQAGVPHDTARLRAAIASSAKFLSDVQARAQGHGLIQVQDAWEALQRARDWNPPSFSIEAPLVDAELRPQGPERFTGRGLFELSGWRPGQSGRRTVTVTRTGGDAGRKRYRLRWKGDTDVFRSKWRNIVLPLGKAVELPLDIQVGASGSYSAIVDFVDPQKQLVAGSVPMTVLVADPLPIDGNALQYHRESPRPGNSEFFIEVPPGTSALTVQVKRGASRSYSIWYARDPTGRNLPFNPYGSEIFVSEPTALTSETQQHVFRDPVPGVWQFRMQNQQPHTREAWASVADWSKPMPLDVTIRGWRISSEASTAGDREQVEFRGADRGTSIRAIGIGASRTARPRLLPGLVPAFFDVEIAPGTTRYEVELAHDDPQAQVGLYLYKVPEGDRQEKVLRGDQTALVGYDVSFQSHKRLVLANPLPGHYRVAVDPVRIPVQGLEAVFRDTVFRAGFGALEVTESAGGEGGVRTIVVDAHVQSSPPDGRQLLAQIGVFGEGQGQDAAPISTRDWPIEP